MITRADVEAAYREPEKLRKIVELRNIKKAFYRGEDGVAELASLIKGGGVFAKLDPNDPAAIGAYNLAIDVLDSIGFFDEENLERTVEFLLSLPAFPERGGSKEGIDG